MKKMIWICLLCFAVISLKAQTADEWLRQKKTQKKYLLQQIAALNTYAGYLGKGYSIARAGLGLIDDLKTGDFKLHANYFSSLSQVNQKIKSYTRLAEIISGQYRIIKNIRSVRQRIDNDQSFNDHEKKYLVKVCNNVLDDCGKAIDELADLLTDGVWQMKDDERLLAIDKIYEDMNRREKFTTSFFSRAKLLSLSRKQDHSDILKSKKLNE